MVDFRINWALPIGEVRKPRLPFACLVGAVSNCAVSTHHDTYVVELGNRTYRGAKVSIYF